VNNPFPVHHHTIQDFVHLCHTPASCLISRLNH